MEMGDKFRIQEEKIYNIDTKYEHIVQNLNE